MDKVKIVITEEDISKSIPCDSYRCVVSRAVRRVLGLEREYEVRTNYMHDTARIYVGAPEDKVSMIYSITDPKESDDVYEMMNIFDSESDVDAARDNMLVLYTGYNFDIEGRVIDA